MSPFLQRTKDELTKKSRLQYGIILLVAVAILCTQSSLSIYSYSGELDASALVSLKDTESDGVRVLKEKSAGGEATMILELKESEPGSDTIAVGDHKAHFIVSDPDCVLPRFRVRLVGESLVSFHLVQQGPEMSKKQQIWTGTFHIQIAGTYKVDAQWHGCSPPAASGGETTTPTTATTTTLEFPGIEELQAVGERSVPAYRSKDSYLFADSAWVAMKNDSLPEYMWINPEYDLNKPRTKYDQLEFIPVHDEKKHIDTAIYRSGTLKDPHGYYLFNHVGNYEIVCFWGSGTMSDIKDRFLAILQAFDRGVRKFKFHYHRVDDMQHPDAHWKRAEQELVRKCKHIFWSVDEFARPSLSQAEYKEQLTQHVGQLQEFLNHDETLPIWLLSVNENPLQASNCLSPPQVLPRTTDHPCNDVLKNMFRSGEEVFSTKQVHFMDNTDLFLPHFSGDDRDAILSNIAMRIFVAVGKGVWDWRDSGQFAIHDGIHRCNPPIHTKKYSCPGNTTNVLYPNFDLIPFNWSHPEMNPKLDPLTGDWIPATA